VADLGEGPRGPCPPLFWVKKGEMTEGRKAGRASKTKPGPPLSSKSGSGTVFGDPNTIKQSLIVFDRETFPVWTGLNVHIEWSMV